jgi:glycosyltransferase involved in cell wall biosynthesis
MACAMRPIPISKAAGRPLLHARMKIAFYAPLKPPDHPVPSGDRQMARQLIAALGSKGNIVTIASHLRSYLKGSSNAEFKEAIANSRDEISRITREWSASGPADMWLSYHPYYRAPDLLGPIIAEQFGIPYVTCEASYAAKRDRDAWQEQQSIVKEAVRQAALNICFTNRDRQGLAEIVTASRLANVPPFIAVDRIRSDSDRPPSPPGHLIAVAMMRAGVKFESFKILAAVLALLQDVPWHLTIVGHGPLNEAVKELFRDHPQDRLRWAGEVMPEQVPHYLRQASIYVWPGCGEAYGLAYLEAQGVGLPVIAQNSAGVPEVVIHGKTGLLLAEGDIAGFAAAIRRWIGNPAERAVFGARARDFVHGERSLEKAAEMLHGLLSELPTAAKHRHG